jgi:membrane-associated phospholipid phosphatase
MAEIRRQSRIRARNAQESSADLTTRTTSCLLALTLCAAPAVVCAEERPRLDTLAAQALDAPQGDGRRTMGAFFPNLGRNFVGIFRGDSLRPLAFGAVLAGAGTLLDDRAERYFEGQGRAPRLGSVGHTVGSAAVMVPVSALMFLAGRGSSDSRFRAATYDVAQATIVTQGYTTALKLAVSRTRPDESDRLSFPSGHTSNAFALATVLRHHYGTRAGLAAYGAAGLIGLSRIERNVHHVSDVVAGAAIGYAVGRTVVREDGKPVGRARQLDLYPATDAHGSGVGLGVSLSF